MFVSWLKGLLLHLQQTLGKSSRALKLVLILRNQLNIIMAFGFAGWGEPVERYFATGNEGLPIQVFAPRSSTFIDVGANIGDWTDYFLRYSQVGSRGLLFEPNPGTYATLLERYRGNGSVEVCNMGLGDMEGTVEFWAEPDAGCSSSFAKGVSSQTAQMVITRITTLDSEVRRRAWDTIDYLKIDAEGYDFRVLKGALPLIKDHRIKVLQFEYVPAWLVGGGTLYEALRLLEDHTYQTWVLRHDGLYEFSYAKLGEFFRYAVFVACVPDLKPIAGGIVRGKIC